MACLLGILHHVRPGFLSYPASHLVPYLRIKKYPPEVFPEMYKYRAVSTRLLAKLERAYRRFEPIQTGLSATVLQDNATALPCSGSSVDAIVSSPPYYGALDYGRDNRLRLWFLGMDDYKQLEVKLTSRERVYIPQMTQALGEMLRVLKSGRSAVLVLGDYNRNGRRQDSATALAQIVEEEYPTIATVKKVLVDEIPDDRRTRRRTRTTNHESIIVVQKRLNPGT